MNMTKGGIPVKKSWILAICIALAAALSIGGTMAYLQDSDSDVNVMTLGSVTIEQIEQQRDAAGALEGFKNDKPLYPGVYLGHTEDKLPMEGDYYASDVSNAVDKIVSVKNTGKSEAYVRTWFAFEQGTMTAEDFDRLMILNRNTTDWTWSEPLYDQTVSIDGVDKNCVIYYAIYQKPLAAGATTEVSLRQVLLSKDADNDDMTALNADGTYSIEVISQAVQTAGFADAKTALDEAFQAGYPNTESVPGEEEPEIQWVDVKSGYELQAALAQKPYIRLIADVTMEDAVLVPQTTTIDLNGNTLTMWEYMLAYGAGVEQDVVLTITNKSGKTETGGIVLGYEGTKQPAHLGVLNKGKLVLENVKITETEGRQNGFMLHFYGTAADRDEISGEIIGCHLENRYDLSGRGIVSANATIRVKDTTITSKERPVALWGTDATLENVTLNNSKSWSVVYAKNSNVTLKGSNKANNGPLTATKGIENSNSQIKTE